MSQCYVKQLRGLRQREQSLPESPPDPVSPLRQPSAPTVLGLWPPNSLTPRAREQAARVLRTVSDSSERQRPTSAGSGALSGTLSPTGSIGLSGDPAVSERQRVQALQLVFTAVMEDVISALSGCAPHHQHHGRNVVLLHNNLAEPRELLEQVLSQGASCCQPLNDQPMSVFNA